MGSITALSMKLLVLAIAAISTVSASKAVTCDECQAAVTDLVARLLSEESLAEQKAILKLTVCPQLPDIDCEGTLDMWFPDMAGCIYNHFMLEQDVCGELLGLCYKKSQKVQLLERVSDWTCEECTDILARAADYMSSEETVTEAVAYPRETVSVVRMVTLRSAPLWWRLCCPWRCLSSEPPSWSSPLSSARKWSVSAKCFHQIKLKSLI